MAIDKHELKALALELSAALPPMPPRPVVLVCETGEMFSPQALILARVYDAATTAQRAALDQVSEAFSSVKRMEGLGAVA